MKQKNIYIILTGILGNIGGGQIYTKNKYVFLKDNGWDVIVLSAHFGDTIMINELKDFKNNVIREFQYPPYIFTKKNIIKIITNITKKISLDLMENSKIIVESHSINLALWGELIAEKYNCKHFIFLLNENFAKQSISIIEYLDFKHKRKEIAGIHEKSLGFLFNGYKSLKEEERYFLRAMCSNSVDDVSNSLIDKIDKMDINICCISRLQKPFISTMIAEIIYFAKKNKDKKIQVVLVGGSPNNKIEENIKEKLKSIQNISLVMTGRLFPIPKKLFNLIDIFIGVAGCAQVSANEGALTLVLDVSSHKPIGILEYDTQETLYSDSYKYDSISKALEEILIIEKIHENYRSKFKTTTSQRKDFKKEFQNHLDFIKSSVHKKEYYNITGMEFGAKNKIKKILLRIFGINKYEIAIKNYSYCQTSLCNVINRKKRNLI